MKRGMLALAVLAVLATAGVARAQDPAPLTSLNRKLHQTTEPMWPYCRCTDYSCVSSPYMITPSNPTAISSTVTEFSFTIHYKGAAANPGTPCWTSLINSLWKLEFYTNANCLDSWNAAGKYIAINGVRKTSSIYFETYTTGGVLKMTSLGLNVTTANGAVVTIRSTAPCNTPSTFFNQSRGMGTEVVFLESSNNVCCPRNCAPPPPPPPPPSPRPPSPRPPSPPPPSPPPPSPPPPSPPPPLELRADYYPHNKCWPANPVGFGGVGLGQSKGVPYKVSWTDSGVANKYCFETTKIPCGTASDQLLAGWTDQCCAMNLDKVEFPVKSDTCRQSIRNIVIDNSRGLSISGSNNWDPSLKAWVPVVKFTGLGFTYTGPATHTVCFELSQADWSPCKNFDDVFMTETGDADAALYGVFDDTHGCCGFDIAMMN